MFEQQPLLLLSHSTEGRELKRHEGTRYLDAIQGNFSALDILLLEIMLITVLLLTCLSCP